MTLRNLNTPEDYQAALTMAGPEVADPATAGNEPRPPACMSSSLAFLGCAPGSAVWRSRPRHWATPCAPCRRACPALLGSVLSSEGSLQPAYTLNLNGDRFITDPSTPLRDGDSLILLAVDVGG